MICIGEHRGGAREAGRFCQLISVNIDIYICMHAEATYIQFKLGRTTEEILGTTVRGMENGRVKLKEPPHSMPDGPELDRTLDQFFPPSLPPNPMAMAPAQWLRWLRKSAR